MGTVAVDVQDWQSHYPFASHYLQLEGHRLHYVDEGAGHPLLFVHGNPTWSFYWRNLISAWRDRYRTVAPDHLGCGFSDKPQRFDYCLRSHADHLVRLIRRLDLWRITLLVHDWGGPIGLLAAVEQPERFARLVLLNTGAFPPPRVPWRIVVCRTPLLGTVAVRGLNLFARAAQRMATCAPGGLEDTTLAGLIAPYDTWAHRVAIDRFVRDIPLTVRHPTYDVLRHLELRLNRLNHLPCLLLWGLRDWCFDEACLSRLGGCFPQAETERLPSAGHWVVEDAPGDVYQRVDQFLTSHPLEPASHHDE